MATEVETENYPERQPIEPGTMFALVAAFVSFVFPVIPAIVAIIAAQLAKRRLRRAGGDRMNEGLNTLAQLTALFTLSLFGIFIWRFEVL